MLKITSGFLKGRHLKEPPKDISRPTVHKVRQALFNILIHQYDGLEGKLVLDAFSGSGAFGLEAVSHKAHKVYFIENNPQAISVLNANITSLGMQESSYVFKEDFFKLQAPEQMDYIFLDPPYGKFEEEKVFATLIGQGWLKADTIIIFEKETPLSSMRKDSWMHLDSRNYGRIFLEFWKVHPEFFA